MLNALFNLGITFIVLGLPLHVFGQATWTQKADMPTPRSLSGSAVVDGKIFVIGGRIEGEVPTAANEMYDPETDTWTERAPLPVALEGPSVAAVDGLIYALGGTLEGGGFLSGAVYAYDPVSDIWTPKADMLYEAGEVETISFDGKIYAMGGVIGDREGTTAVAVYDPAADTWTSTADLPASRFGHCTHVLGGQVYFIGGSISIIPDTKDAEFVDIYDPATGAWTNSPNLPTIRGDFASGIVNGKVYIIGGHRGPGTPIHSLVHEFDPGVGPTSVEVLSWGAVKTLIRR